MLSPLLLVIAGLVKLTSSGSVFFVQERIGLGRRRFPLYKFRTMTDKPRALTGEILPGNPEVTFIGRVIRRLKLDEVPQLWNVLVGDMSLVGPRPDVPRQSPINNPAYARRFHVQPGLTGMSQVHGNIYLSWEQRWEYDAMYVDRASLKMDLWLIWRTFGVLVLGEKRYLMPFSEEARCKKH